MNRIERIFSDLRASGRRALMPFVTVGDPDIATTEALLPAMERAGASVVELGLAFSDPIADGPTIQASMARALEGKGGGGAGEGGGGVRVKDALAMVRRVRPHVELGLVAMGSYSIVHRYGLERFVGDAAEAGVDGLILPDLPLEEAEEARDAAAGVGLVLAMLVSPTTPLDRARRIAGASSGFVYVLARSGLTGERAELPAELPERLAGLREATDLPLAVGFGISTPEQVREVTRVAEAAIVGSAVVRRIEATADRGREAVVREVEDFVRELAGGLASGD